MNSRSKSGSPLHGIYWSHKCYRNPNSMRLPWISKLAKSAQNYGETRIWSFAERRGKEPLGGSLNRVSPSATKDQRFQVSLGSIKGQRKHIIYEVCRLVSCNEQINWQHLETGRSYSRNLSKNEQSGCTVPIKFKEDLKCH